MTSITLDSLIQRTGREFGPDICLKVDDAIKTLIDNGVITAQSNITEVLNVIAYFCNTSRTDATGIVTNDSIDLTQSGLHNDATGQYNAPNTGSGIHAESLWKNDDGSVTSQMININTLQTLADFSANHIPVGILMRNGVDAAGALKETNTATDAQRAIDAVAAAAAAPIPDRSVLKTVFINCIKQMINIMEQTRTIFGPKGWANLYRKMNGGGGGGANKNHIKRTHRQHRRRYSSKQY